MSKPESNTDGANEVDVKQLGSLTAQVLKNPEALALMQSKLAGMVGTMSGYYDTLPKVVKRRVKALKKLQVESLKIEAKMAEEIHELECKYAALFEPLHQKRADIVNGVHEPTDAEADFPSDDEEDEDDDEAAAENGEKDGAKDKKEADKEAAETTSDSGEKPEHGFDENTKGIPEFWLTIFKSVELIAENLQDHDMDILTHLTDVRVKNTLSPKGFTLEFHFSPNDHFTNSVLTKRYELKCEVDPDDPFSFEGAEISSCEGCEINWKKGKNVTIRQVTKKQKHKTKGTTRSVTKQVQNDSFFNFFSPPAVPENEDDMDDETQALLSADYEIGEVMRQRLVQRAVLFFTGEALDEDDYDDEEDEEDEDEMDDDEEDSENDSDFDPATAAKGKAGKGGKGKQQNPEECKQQ